MNAKQLKGFSPEKKTTCDKLLRAASKALLEGDAAFFLKLPPREQWRLYASFKDEALFLDIEIGNTNKDLILIGMSNGLDFTWMVKGMNLEKETFFKELKKYKILITFNGAAFDIPVLERYFKTAITLPHIDLKHCCLKLCLKGGLKEVERVLNLKRPASLYGNPSDAWRAFHASGDREYLDALLKYNEEDVLNLKPIADFCFQKLKEKLISPYIKKQGE